MDLTIDRLRDNLGLLAIAGVAAAVGIGVVLMGHMPADDDGLILAFLAYVGGVLALGWGFKEYRRRSLVANTPTSTVRSLALGLVELEGTARPGDTALRAPFSGRDCVLYKYEIEEYRRRGKHSHWETIATDSSADPFYLDDGTGQVMIDPRGADLRLPQDDQYRVDSFDELPETAQQFLRDSGIDTQQDEWFEEDRRYTEYLVTPGQHTYVFGKAFPRRDVRGSTVNPENAYINTDRDTPMFVISDQTEEDLMSGMRWHVWGGIGGGFLFTVAGFASLLLLVGLL